MQCLPPGTRLSDHLQPVVCAVYLNDIPLCHENRARVPRPSLPRAGDAIHPALGKGVVWFTRLDVDVDSRYAVSYWRNGCTDNDQTWYCGSSGWS